MATGTLSRQASCSCFLAQPLKGSESEAPPSGVSSDSGKANGQLKRPVVRLCNYGCIGIYPYLPISIKRHFLAQKRLPDCHAPGQGTKSCTNPRPQALVPTCATAWILRDGG